MDINNFTLQGSITSSSYVNTKVVVDHVQQNAWSMYIYNTHKATDKVVCMIHDDPL
jgi:hypothetical protein